MCENRFACAEHRVSEYTPDTWKSSDNCRTPDLKFVSKYSQIDEHYCMYVCMYVCIDSSARRPNHTEFEKTTESEQTTARLGAVREVSEERPRNVREASEARPGGVRGASGRRPRSVRELSERRPHCVPNAFVAKPGARMKKVAIPRRAV